VIVAIESHQGALYMQVSTIGLDIAKNVSQVHGIDAAEKVVVRKRLPPAARQTQADASDEAAASSSAPTAALASTRFMFPDFGW
jgi:hypothetical protein